MLSGIAKTWIAVSTAMAGALIIYLFFCPLFMMARSFSDPGWRGDRIPRFAFFLHKKLSPRYEEWATNRVASGNASTLSANNISGTEWPLFGSVFYLWATESLQEAWENDRSLGEISPLEAARGAVEAAAALVADPGHAAWVRWHWGENYLSVKNLFYRMLLISAFTSHEKLVGDGRYRERLREQTLALTRELEDSPSGLLDDYPGECYPGDVMAAILSIKRAQELLGYESSAFVARAARAIQTDPATGLPAYMSDAESGRVLIGGRGCSNSYALFISPELWPETAKNWYQLYERQFWQRRHGIVGFREFPASDPLGNWYLDVDAGPVIHGFGVAASAFGVAAARIHGRYDHAYPLSLQMLAMSWPLLDGSLLLPRVLSNAADAPYLGEAALLFCMTRRTAVGFSVTEGTVIPPFFWMLIGVYVLLGTYLLWSHIRLRRRRLDFISAGGVVRHFFLQLAGWVLLVAGGLWFFFLSHTLWGLLMLSLATVLPRIRLVGGSSRSLDGSDSEKLRVPVGGGVSGAASPRIATSEYFSAPCCRPMQ